MRKQAKKKLRRSTETAPDTSSRKGGVLAALRRSPLVGAGMEFPRPLELGRQIDLASKSDRPSPVLPLLTTLR